MEQLLTLGLVAHQLQRKRFGVAKIARRRSLRPAQTHQWQVAKITITPVQRTVAAAALRAVELPRSLQRSQLRSMFMMCVFSRSVFKSTIQQYLNL
jgi:hypothetical protein